MCIITVREGAETELQNLKGGGGGGGAGGEGGGMESNKTMRHGETQSKRGEGSVTRKEGESEFRFTENVAEKYSTNSSPFGDVSVATFHHDFIAYLIG